MEKSVFTKPYKALIERLKQMRKAAGLTQRDVAVKMGCVRNLIARVELGERRIDVFEFYRYCIACGQNPEKVTVEVMRDFRSQDKAGARRK